MWIMIRRVIRSIRGTNSTMAIVQNDAAERTRTILVVEDEPAISGFVRRGLIFEGFDVQVVDNGTDALSRVRDTPPDMLVLDLMLPGIDGIQITQRIRAAEVAERTPRLPILMLTARDAVADRVAGLDAGADDYLIKPFDFDELVARVRALLRRALPIDGAQQDVLTFDDIELNLTSHTVTRGTTSIELTPREFDLLAILMRHPNQVLTRQTLMQRVWGDDFYGESNVLEVVIRNLRRALEANDEQRVVQTVRGIGYVLRLQ